MLTSLARVRVNMLRRARVMAESMISWVVAPRWMYWPLSGPAAASSRRSMETMGCPVLA